MAGGIDWLRWHHGSVTDPKFQLVAKRAQTTLPNVLAVWAYVLEQASAADVRGCFDTIDAESVDCLFGFEDGVTQSILMEMEERELIDSYQVLSWEKRQPKREDESAAERKRRQREREHDLQISGCVTNEASRNVTQSHADVTQCHDRGEERREEKRERGKTKRVGTRLPDDWSPSAADIEFCQTERPDLEVAITAARFKDYWISKPDGLKLNWSATWRNWVRNEKAGQTRKASGALPWEQ